MECNIADLFECLVDAVPDSTAVVAGDRRLSFAQLEARANRLAHYFLARGIKPGDHVGLYLYNDHQFLEGMLAALKIRAVPINVNYRYVEDELKYLFENADLVAVVFQQEFAPYIAHIRQDLPGLHTLLAVEDDSGTDLLRIGAVPFERALAQGDPTRDFAPRSPQDLFIIYTGGTTGMPRGVMWQQCDLFYAGLQGGSPGGEPCQTVDQLLENVKNGMPMAILPAAPFIHGAAQWSAWIAWFTGGCCVLTPGRSFEPKRVWEMVAREKVTTMTVVGDAMARPLVEALRAAEGAYDTSSLLAIASAGAVLSEHVKLEWQELLPNAMILNNFGSTETGHQGAAFDMGEPGGRPRFFMYEGSTVLDDDLQPIEPGSGVVGRLARTGRIPLGYYKDPGKTAATFVELAGRRWVMPGDMATIEEDGMITVFGRGSVCINTGGEKVFTEEVEEALKAHPAVLDAVVTGVPDERWGQRVAALVKLRPGMSLGAPTLVLHARKHVAGYKVPRDLYFVEDLQRHPSGKPDFRWARETAIALGQAASRS